MKLYHGTNVDFEKIDLSKSKPNKDFGRGFYLSPDLEQAKQLAQARVELLGGSPVILTYEFDEALLSSGQLNVKTFDDYTQEWAEFILANRHSPTGEAMHDYDIVVGPIANDRVGLQLWKYLNRDIDMPTLIQRLKYMKGITIQYYFGTEDALKHLKRI